VGSPSPLGFVAPAEPPAPTQRRAARAGHTSTRRPARFPAVQDGGEPYRQSRRKGAAAATTARRWSSSFGNGALWRLTGSLLSAPRRPRRPVLIAARRGGALSVGWCGAKSTEGGGAYAASGSPRQPPRGRREAGAPRPLPQAQRTSRRGGDAAVAARRLYRGLVNAWWTLDGGLPRRGWRGGGGGGGGTKAGMGKGRPVFLWAQRLDRCASRTMYRGKAEAVGFEEVCQGS